MVQRFFSGKGKPRSETAGCMYCGGTEGHWETVWTGDHESVEGFEDWFCCHPCRDAGKPCDTFQRILPLDEDEVKEYAKIAMATADMVWAKGDDELFKDEPNTPQQMALTL